MIKENEGRGLFRVGEVGQWVGMAASVAGLVVEIATGADIGYAVLTCGSLVWAVGTKVKYYRGRKGVPRGSRSRVRQ